MASSQGLEMGGALLAGWASTASVPSLHAPGAWERLLFQLGALSGEYLFFIGASMIAVLLLARRRWLLAGFGLALAVLWLSFHLPVSLYLESLGADSFAETQDFDLEEARFWAGTLREAIEPDFSLKKFAAYLAVALLGLWALHWLLQRREFTRRRCMPLKLGVALCLMVLAFHQTTAKALAFYLENTEKFHATAGNFGQAAPQARLDRPGLDLLVYIGESTSVMNMALYGYSRPTTPELSRLAAEDPRLVVFDHVFATHAHTSRSLLEALSFGVDAAEAYLPITERKRISVVDVMRQAGLEPRLLSNQGQGGSWDQASSVIFRHSLNTFRSRAAQVPGGPAADRPWDHEFFADRLAALAPPPDRPQVVFLHSYSGHGPYHKNIPPRFRQPVDGQLQALDRAQVVREPGVSLAQIEEYDAAVRYVDFSVRQTIAHVQAQARPTALVYFSDHGDAVYAGLGHDSARFRHEMARVPFLVYFNEAAVKARPELLPRYRALAGARRIATLAQLPSTLLDLLGARVQPGGSAVLQTPVVGAAVELPPILVRRTAEGITVVNLSGQPAPATTPGGLAIWDRTDEDTRRYLAARTQTQARAQACPGVPTSLEEMSRHTMLMSCAPGTQLAARGAP